MIVSLKGWVISICSTVFFITAVEMIFPNNSMKKYAKFVLGLILITVIINPILKFINNNYNIDNYTNNVMNYVDNSDNNNYEKYKQENADNTLSTFKTNLANSCNDILVKKYPGNSFKIDIDASYDKDNDIKINSVKIGVKDGAVESVKKVEINLQKKAEDTSNVLNDSKSKDIKGYISNELNIPDSSIIVYKYN